MHRAVINDRSAPTAFHADLVHQSMEWLSIRHTKTLNDRLLSGKRFPVLNGNNWATAEGRLSASAVPSANVATWWLAALRFRLRNAPLPHQLRYGNDTMEKHRSQPWKSDPNSLLGRVD